MTAPRPLVGVVADDITGAGDIGLMFAKHGYAVRVFTAQTELESLPERLAGKRTDVIVVDTDSRLEPPGPAADRVRRATAALVACGCELFWKKTCSVFRGNVGVEFDAMLDQLGTDFGVAVAAFPANGRQTRGGVHSVHGRLLAESEFARDPVHPMTESDLVVVLGKQTGRPVRLLPLETVRAGPETFRAELERLRAGGGYALCDAETADDLDRLAAGLAREPVLLGSSGLAEALPGVWEAPASFDPLAGAAAVPGPALVLAGSVMPQSQAQVAAFAGSGATVLTLDGRTALADPDGAARALAAEALGSLEAGRPTAVRSENWPEAVAATRALGAELGLSPVEVSRRVSGLLAEVARRVFEAGGPRPLVVLGGDSSAAACRALGVEEMLVLSELAPGLPSSLVVGPGPWPLVLKSGSFGPPDFQETAIAHLVGLAGGG